MSQQPPKKKHKPNNTVQQPAAMSVSPGFRDIMPSVQYVVIDTNNFMQYLEDVLQLRNQTQFTVIVPLTVVQELDGLKKQDDEVGFTARTALKHIHQVLTSGEKWLRCQTSSEVPLSTANFGIPRPAHTKNDDTILNCSLFLRSLHNVVALVTSDFALAVKAISAGMHTCDMKGLLQCLPPLSASPTAAFVPREPTTDPAEREAAARPQVVKVTETKEDIPGFAFTSQTPTNYYGEEEDEEEEYVNPELQQQYQQQYEKYQQQLQKEKQLAALNSDSTGMELDGPVLHEGLTEESWLNILSYLTTEDLLKLKIVSKFWYRMSKNESLWQRVITKKFCCGKEDLYKVLTKNKPPMLWYLTWRQSILPVRPSAVENADDKKKADYTFFF